MVYLEGTSRNDPHIFIKTLRIPPKWISTTCQHNISKSRIILIFRITNLILWCMCCDPVISIKIWICVYELLLHMKHLCHFWYGKCRYRLITSYFTAKIACLSTLNWLYLGCQIFQNAPQYRMLQSPPRSRYDQAQGSNICYLVPGSYKYHFVYTAKSYCIYRYHIKMW